MDDPLAILGFLSIFHIVGAVALANGLRGVWNWLSSKERGTGNALFFVVWGTGFGCLPFVIGLAMMADEETGAPLVLLGEVIAWGGVFLTALLAWDEVMDWLRPFLHPDLFLIAFGGVFMLVGATVGSLIIRDDLLFGSLLGGVFMLVGGLLLAVGLRNLFKAMRQ